MLKLMKKTITIFLVMAVVISNLPLGTIAAGVRPSVSISAPSVTSIEEGASVSYRVTYSSADEIYLSKDYVNLNGFTATINVSGEGDVKTVTLSNVQGTAGKKNISIRSASAENENGMSLATPNSVSFMLTEKVVNNDTNNNTNNNVNNNTNNNTNNTPNVPVVAADTVRPSVSISAPSVKNVNVGGTVKFTVSFSDNVAVAKVNLSKDYINLNGFTADVNVNGTTVILSNIQGAAGNKNISIKAGAAGDAAGNNTLATPNSISFALNGVAVKGSADEVRPSVSISEPSAKTVYAGGTITYVISFADNREVAKVNLSKDYLTFNGFTADVKVTGEGNVRTVTLSNIQGEVGKNYNIVVLKGAAEDAAGNMTIQTPHSISFQIVKKTTAPATKLDNEPNTGIESLPVLPIMGGASAILGVAGYILTKKLYK